MICPYCGTENRNTAKFCDSCGYELPTVAPDAREMFGGDDILVEGQDAITVDLQGLERMVDSSNSGILRDQVGTDDLYGGYADHYADDCHPTIPFDGRSKVIGQAYRSEADPYGDVYTTKTIPIVATPHQTAEFGAVSDAGATSSLGAGAKVFSADTASSGSKSKKKLIGGVVAVLVVALLAAAALITYNLQLWGGIALPDVVRQSEQSATQTLEEAGFAVDVEYVVSDDVEGIVISTTPSAGTRIEEGSLVVIAVSIPRTVPEIVGLTQEEATKLLNDAGYLDIEFVKEKSNEAEGSVVSVDPAVGTEVVAETHIKVVIAEPFRVPSVEGLTRDAAVQALEAEGYTVKVVAYITEDVPEGMAVSTDPGSGVVLPSGSEVVLNVAHNRSTELIDATKAFFKGASRFNINGVNYELAEVKSVTYQGSDTCAYVISARPYETHTWLFGDTETRYGNYESIEGTIVFNADNSIKSSNPAIKQIG